VTPELLAALMRARGASEPSVVATCLENGAQWLLPNPQAPPWLQDHAALALAQARSGLVNHEGIAWFLHVHAPPHRLLIVGAVHVAQALTRIAAIAGLAPTVIDPRRGFADPGRFPDVSLRHEWPDDALAILQADRRTAIVTLTHDPKLDDPALDYAVRSEAFYVGALGSRKTHAARLERMRARGIPQEALDRIRGPVGLAIGASTAPEIALSILAEIIAVRRGSALSAR
jgi:xanthine dehydrogenase accessory factor